MARYRVEIRLQQEGEPPIRLAREEFVRVPTFQETLRNDEHLGLRQVLDDVEHLHDIVAERLDAVVIATPDAADATASATARSASRNAAGAAVPASPTISPIKAKIPAPTVTPRP